MTKQSVFRNLTLQRHCEELHDEAIRARVL